MFKSWLLDLVMRVLNVAMGAIRQLTICMALVTEWFQSWTIAFKIIDEVNKAGAENTSLDTTEIPDWAVDCAYRLLYDARNPALMLSVIKRIGEVQKFVIESMVEEKRKTNTS